MYKKISAICLIVFFIGISVFGAILFLQRKNEQYFQKQRNAITSRLIKIGSPVVDETNVNFFADYASEENKQLTVQQEEQKQKADLLLAASICCVVAGGTVIFFMLLLEIAHLITSAFSALTKFIIKYFGLCEKRRLKSANSLPNTEDYARVLMSPQFNDLNLVYNTAEAVPSSKLPPADKIQPTKAEPEKNQNKQHRIDLNENQSVEILDQTESLENQLNEFKVVTQSAKANSAEHSQSINSIVEELGQQISAIREYSSYQQEKISKFQQGYDWKIIKTFCLRVIRCIDNLDTRIESLSKNEEDTIDLEEIRDELVFALESSGIEQFSPETKSRYAGKEKEAEVVKEKEISTEPDTTGQIAMVLRPGYRYVIDDKEWKVVRTAKVKLYA